MQCNWLNMTRFKVTMLRVMPGLGGGCDWSEVKSVPVYFVNTNHPGGASLSETDRLDTSKGAFRLHGPMRPV